jgi:hypothetical protein
VRRGRWWFLVGGRGRVAAWGLGLGAWGLGQGGLASRVLSAHLVRGARGVGSGEGRLGPPARPGPGRLSLATWGLELLVVGNEPGGGLRARSSKPKEAQSPPQRPAEAARQAGAPLWCVVCSVDVDGDGQQIAAGVAGGMSNK